MYRNDSSSKLKPMHDSYGILKPAVICYKSLPAMHRIFVKHHSTGSWPKYARLFSALVHSSTSQIKTKMLAVFEDGKLHTVRDVHDKLFPSKLIFHDIGSFKSLCSQELIEFAEKTGRTSAYAITEIGLDALKAIRDNEVYYKVTRLFKSKGDFYENALENDLYDGGALSVSALCPKSFASLLEELFDPSSSIRLMGSAYRRMNNVVYLLKSNDEFYSYFNMPEVMRWLDSSREGNAEVAKFYRVFERISKKHSSKEAA